MVWKYGGMYMDADMVLLRDPTLLPLGMSTQVCSHHCVPSDSELHPRAGAAPQSRSWSLG